MKLQKVSILILGSSFIIFILVISIFFSTILLASYSDLEEQYVKKDLSQAVYKLEDELNAMSSIASDWGPWDDSVEFINGKDTNYLNSNLQPYGFDNLNLNLIVLANTKGEILFSGSYDLQNKVMIPVPLFFSKQIDLNDPLMNMSDPHQVVTGILMLNEDPLLIVSQPIVYSNYTGPAQGVIIMGRYLNHDEISKLAALTRPSLTFTRTDNSSLQADLILRIKENGRVVPELIQTLNPDQVAGYALIRDIYGKDALILQITETRDIYHQGIKTTLQVILIILVGGLLLGFVVIILLDHVVLRRMGSLALQVKKIGKTGDTMDHIEIHGDDELSGLADEINRMLKTIEMTQQKVQVSETQFRDLIENLPDYIMVYGLNMEILYINPAAAKALGYDVKTLIGTKVLSYVADEFRDQVIAQVKVREESGNFPPYEVEIVSKGGIRRSVIVKARSIQYNNSPATFLLLIDITQRKELEDEREYHAQELERYSSSLHQANTKLHLLTGLTRHDIQNKLTAMQSFHLLAMEESDMAVNHDYIQHAHQAGRRMEAIIAFTREYENFGIISSGWQFVYQTIESALSEIPLNEVMIENHIPEDLEIYVDPIFRKVFTTLMENSIRHGEKLTTIQFSCFERENNLIIICEDDGVGIPSAEKEYIFDQGYGKHTGIGLFLAREILSLTGLTIRECGEPGKSARFEFNVPKGGWRVHKGIS